MDCKDVFLSKPLVSVVVPIYNAGDYLRPCLDTLVNQTLHNIEIICVLDCPTDGSDRVVEEYANKDNRIVVIKNENNLHIGKSRNIGIRVAHGEFIGFSDHDDTRELDMYEKLFLLAEQRKCDVVLSGKFVRDNFKGGFDNNDLRKQCLHALICRKGTAHVTPHLFRKKFIEENGLSFVDTKLLFGEDILFNINALCCLKDNLHLTASLEVFYHHIETGKNTADFPSYCSIPKLSVFVNKCRVILQEFGFYDELKEDMSVLLLRMSYTILKKDIKREGYRKAVREFKTIVVGDVFCIQLIRGMSVTMKGLTLPKRAFVLWLKRLC